MGKKKIIYFAIGPIGSAAISFVTLPLITWYFSIEDVGRFSLLQTLTGFATLVFCLGFDQAFVRSFYASKHPRSLFISAYLPPLIGYACVVALSFYFSNELVVMLFGEDAASNLWQVLIVSCGLSFSVRFLSLILRVSERGLAYSISQMSPKVLLLLLVFVSVNVVGGDFMTLALSYMISLLAVFCVLIFNNRKFLFFTSGNYDITLTKQMFSFGAPLIISSIAFWGLTVSDKILISKLSSYSELGLYSVSVSFAGAAIVLQSVFSTIWSPLIYRWIDKDNMADNEVATHINKMADVMLLIVVVGVSLAGSLSFILDYILPEQYSQAKYIMLSCMCYPLFYTLSEVTVVGLHVKKCTIISMLITLMSFLVNLSGNLILIPTHGAKGAAVSTAVSFWLFLVLRTEFSSKYYSELKRMRLYLITLMVVGLTTANLFCGAEQVVWFSVTWLAIGTAYLSMNYKKLSYLK
ncbi:lipopolysaccharide biosynthesis protein [Vibrio furnissii]|uniref:lipopolysaccharide biosynthesis protein n=1 Tax=Vibrio furnissii TaxID=29494 RepID=UPI0023D9A139|nr:oligosaccharide flippase family protein [Vibrio furnissii]